MTKSSKKVKFDEVEYDRLVAISTSEKYSAHERDSADRLLARMKKKN